MQKPKTFRPWNPEQMTLLPPSPSDWLSDDHQVYFLLDLVDELDLSAILIPAQSKDPRGEKGFDPRMMTLLLLYAYCVGIVSSRRIERACYEDLAFRVLTANQQPDHSRISEFRRRNLDALSDLFVQILRLCQKAGMVNLGHVALDGTKVQANASKHKAMSHERMLKAEKQLEKEINALMRRAEILDAQEDQRYGKGKRGRGLPDELRRRQERLARIRQARKEMEAETAAAAARQRQQDADDASAKATAAQQADAPAAQQAELNKKAEVAAAKARAARDKAVAAAEDSGIELPDLEPLAEGAMPRRGLARKADGTPTSKSQRIHRSAEAFGYTDPDSHLMQSGGSYLQGYNCQLAVDRDHQVIVAVGVSSQAPDVEHLEPMTARIAANKGAMPVVMTLDAGYWSEANAQHCEQNGSTPTTATRKPRATPQADCPMASRHRPNEGDCPEMLTPNPAWPASSEASRDQRSMPNARRSSSPSTVRSKRPGVCAGSCSGAWRRSIPSGT